MNNAKSYPPISIIFAIGAFIGIGVGLWIGWGLWPVEWQGATLRDLDQTGKAEYIAAVADAFVIYDTPEAAAIARQRLAPLEETLENEFIESIRYFQASDQTERVIRVSNIGRLASALGMIPPDLQTVANTAPDQAVPTTSAAGAVEAGSDNTTIDGATTTQVDQSSSSAAANVSWFRWLLWLLAAILLLSGGLYLMGAAGLLNIQQLLSRLLNNNREDMRVDEFEEEEYSHPSDRVSNRQRNHPVTFVADSEDLSFEQDEDDIDRFRYEPSTTPTTRLQEWQQDEWPDAEFNSGVNPRVGPGYHDNDYRDVDYSNVEQGSIYVTDVDNAFLDDEGNEEDWNSAFEQEPEDAYDRFRSPPAEQNPAHFTIDSVQQSDTSAFKTSSTPGFPDAEDETKVQTIDDLMAGRISSAPFEPATDDIQEDTDRIREDWQDEEDADIEEIDAEEIDTEEIDAEHANPSFRYSQGDEENQGIVTSFPKEELDRFAIDPLRHRTTQAPTTELEGKQHDALPQRQREKSPAETTPASKRPRHQLIVQHTLAYQMGMAEYDESKPIVDPSSGKYIGEFGMGTSGKNSVVQPNGEYVAALEVWLFDKSDEKNMGNQTRILLSEYAIDHNLEDAFTKERTDNPRPFTPQAGVHFQLESQNLRLDCTIVDVKYLESGVGKGMFGSIRVDMSIHQKS